MISRSLWHTPAEAARVVAAARPRPRDLPATLPLLRLGATLAGVGLAAARRSPRSAVLIDHLGPLDGVGLTGAVRVLAAALDRAGAGPGRPVAIHCGDHRGLVAAVLAAGAIGADALLVGPSVGTTALATVLASARPAVVVHDPATGERLPVDGPPRVDALATLAASRAAGPLPRGRRPGRLRMLTSGTTGAPRVASRAGVGPRQAPTALSLLAALGLRRGEPVLLLPPLSHGHGMSLLVAAFVAGAPAVLGHGMDGPAMLAAVRRNDVGTVAGVPAQLAAFADAVADDDDAPPLLRRVAAGSAPLDPALAARLLAVFGDALVDFYGTSETGTLTVATADDVRSGTVGRPATGVRIAVVDDHGRPVPAGSTGVVHASSAFRARGTAAGPVPTGDLGRLDAAGRLVLEGRCDDVAVVGGHNVHVPTVREWFARQPGVSDAVVHGEGDPRLGVVLVAEVSGVGLEPGDLAARARSELGPAAAPRTVRLR